MTTGFPKIDPIAGSQLHEAGFPEYESLDEVQSSLFSLIQQNGAFVAPRGLATKELLNVGFTLTNPRARLTYNEARRWSIFLAVGEFFWHLAGDRNASTISYYAPTWSNFADGGVIRSSCYGYKIFRPQRSRISQWERVLEIIRSDPE